MECWNCSPVLTSMKWPTIRLPYCDSMTAMRMNINFLSALLSLMILLLPPPPAHQMNYENKKIKIRNCWKYFFKLICVVSPQFLVQKKKKLQQQKNKSKPIDRPRMVMICMALEHFQFVCYHFRSILTPSKWRKMWEIWINYATVPAQLCYCISVCQRRAWSHGKMYVPNALKSLFLSISNPFSFSFTLFI